MAGFIGEYNCKLDAKGRFLLPAGLRKQVDPSAQETFVVNRGFEGCLNLFPKNEWDVETAKISKLNLYKAKHRKFYRQFHNGATVVELDGNGRVLLPKKLVSELSIGKSVVLFAYANRIEIWDAVKYNAMMDEGMDDYEDLSDEVMGGIEEGDE